MFLKSSEFPPTSCSNLGLAEVFKFVKEVSFYTGLKDQCNGKTVAGTFFEMK